TIVRPDVAERLLGRIGQWFQKHDFTAPGELVKLEDPEFEKLFAVYGTDQIEARYLLSTSLMRRLVDFRNKTGKTIYVSFVKSCVHIAIVTGENMFEPRIFRTVVDLELVRDYFHDLTLATGIVEDLNLNTRIWSKQ
ncbi:MAG: DUF3137 domain-containing protein, partial [Planctomycetota bacterium]